MKASKILPFLLVILSSAALGTAGTARPYRGPVGELPRAIAGPLETGVVGTARFQGRGRAVEGWSRWEFWWETNKGTFLRAAALERAGADRDPRFVMTPAGESPVPEGTVRERVLPILLARLGDPDPEMRARAAIALGRTGESAALEPLAKLLTGGEATDRAAAAIAIGVLSDPQGVPVLTAHLKRAGVPPAERSAAALGLGFLGGDDAAAVLREILAGTAGISGDGIEDLQASAATALGMLGDRLAIPVLARVVKNRNGRDETVRAAAVLALGRLRSSAALGVLSAALEDHDVDVRRAAAQALGQLGDERGRPPLEAALSDDGDVQVRNFAAIALARIGGEGVLERLAGSLGESSPRALRGFSALAIGILGDPGGREHLRALLDRPDEPSLMAAASIGLALLDDVFALPALRAVSTDATRDDDLRGYATLAQVLLDDPAAPALVGAAARDIGSANRRRAGMTALSLLPERARGRLVLAGLLEETDAYVRGAAIRSLSIAPRPELIDPIATVAFERGFSKDAAKDAVAALGLLSQRGRPTAIEVFLSGVNYRSLGRTGRFVLGIL